jgi:hypothetical protein
MVVVVVSDVLAVVAVAAKTSDPFPAALNASMLNNEDGVGMLVGGMELKRGAAFNLLQQGQMS